MSEMNLERKVRRQLEKHGYHLQKSKAPISIDNLGEYMVIQDENNAVVFGSRYEATLEEVIAWLTSVEGIERKEMEAK